MKKIAFLLLSLFITFAVSAQTQQGYVKTKGRMVDGKHVPGQGLKGATVSIQDRTPVVVKNDEGSFSFPIPAKTFMVKSVKKNGYELVDPDVVRKPYNFSENPIYLVMETPEQQTQDQLESERKIRRILQRQLQQREDELEALKEANRITLEKYQQAMQRLYADQENNEKLISDMAKQYAQMDYDQMDDLNQRISDAILNGRLTEADSLLRSKGDVKSRIAEIRREQQAEAKREEEIAQEQAELEASKAGTQKRLEDIASDCYKFFDLCKLNMQWDSAAYYIEARAELDTTNAEWQMAAAQYLRTQSQLQDAETYTRRSVSLYRQLVQSDHEAYEVDLANALSELSSVLLCTKRFSDSEVVAKEALSICKHISSTSAFNNKAQVVSIGLYSILIDLYLETNRIEECKAILEKEVVFLFMHFAQSFEENEEGFKALYGKMFSTILSSAHSIGMYFLKKQEYERCEEVFQELVDICHIATDQLDSEYELLYAGAMQDLAILFATTKRFDEAEKTFLKALSIVRQFVKNNPQRNERFLAETLIGLSNVYIDSQQFEKSEAPFTEAIEILQRIANNNPYLFECYYKKYYATSCYSLGQVKIKKNAYEEAILYWKEALRVFRELKSNDPDAQNKYFVLLAESSLIYGILKNYSYAYNINIELLPLLKEKYLSDKITFGPIYTATITNQSYYCLFSNDFVYSEQLASEAITLNPSDHLPYTNLAAALLFQGKYSKAEAIYRQYKDELKDNFLQDFNDFEAAGVIPEERKKEVERIKLLLME